jgi:ElaB/YqjD/DUF883 family membrane-anchored ribosome-binding protein
MEATTQANADRLMQDLKVLVRDAEELLKAGAGDLGEKGKELKEKLQESIDAAKVTCRQMEDRALEGARLADKVIREHPYQAAGAAFGVGLLMGLLAARSR